MSRVQYAPRGGPLTSTPTNIITADQRSENRPPLICHSPSFFFFSRFFFSSVVALEDDGCGNLKNTKKPSESRSRGITARLPLKNWTFALLSLSTKIHWLQKSNRDIKWITYTHFKIRQPKKCRLCLFKSDSNNHNCYLFIPSCLSKYPTPWGGSEHYGANSKKLIHMSNSSTQASLDVCRMKLTDGSHIVKT